MNALDVKNDADRAMQELAAAFRATDIVVEDDCVAFDTGKFFVLANVVDTPKRIRIRVYLDPDDEHEVKKWVDAQPTPSSGLLEADDQLAGDWQPRLVFERPLTGVDWSTDPLWGDIERYLGAWLDDTSVQYSAATRVP